MIPLAIIVACVILIPVEMHRRPYRFWVLAAVIFLALSVLTR